MSMMMDNSTLDLFQDIFDSLMEWEDGELIQRDDIIEKASELTQIFTKHLALQKLGK